MLVNGPALMVYVERVVIRIVRLPSDIWRELAVLAIAVTERSLPLCLRLLGCLSVNSRKAFGIVT